LSEKPSSKSREGKYALIQSYGAASNALYQDKKSPQQADNDKTRVPHFDPPWKYSPLARLKVTSLVIFQRTNVCYKSGRYLLPLWLLFPFLAKTPELALSE
jgi:hypothetical protein